MTHKLKYKIAKPAPAKKAIREKELFEFLHAAGCREVTENDKSTEWYKKASKKPACLKTTHKEKTHR